jgi:uncharacterized protein YggE
VCLSPFSGRLPGVVLVLAVVVLGLASGQAHAQAPASPPAQNLDGFTVMGKGATAAKPNRLEIDLEIAASSEMTSDVIVKYRDAKKRLQEAFTALKLGNVAVEERALAVDQKGQVFNPYMMDTPPARKGKVEVQLTRKLVITCTNIKDMDEEALLQLVARLLDVAQDAGAKVGGGGDFNPYAWRYGANNTALVRFILDDFEPLSDKAYEQAIGDARTRATRLARLSGVELGPIAGVREVLIPGEKSQGNSSPYFYYDMGTSNDDEMPRKQLIASKFQEIPVKVELQVRFTTIPAKAEGRGAGQ